MVRSDQPKTAVGTSGNASLGGAAPPGTTRSRCRGGRMAVGLLCPVVPRGCSHPCERHTAVFTVACDHRIAPASLPLRRLASWLPFVQPCRFQRDPGFDPATRGGTPVRIVLQSAALVLAFTRAMVDAAG